jgi:hypothetical protein
VTHSTNEKPTSDSSGDIVDRLRGWRTVHLTHLGYLLIEAADEIERLRALADNRGELSVERRREIVGLREAIRRLADQDATLSVCDGRVTVTMDATLTDAEREAIVQSADFADWDAEYFAADRNKSLADGAAERAATLRGLLERLGGCPPQLDCGADRKSVASQRCRDTGGQPFDSAPTTTLTDAEREAIKRLGPCGDPLASRIVTLTPEERAVFHDLLRRLG